MIEFEITNLDELRRRYDPKIIEKALNSAVKKTANKARTLISKAVRKGYNVKAADIAKALTEKRIRGPVTERILLYTGGRLSLMYFDPQEVRVTRDYGAITTKRGRDGLVSSRAKRTTKRHRELRGVTVMIKKGQRKKVKGPDGYGAFIAQGNRGKSGGGWGRKLFNKSASKEGRGNVQVFMRDSKDRMPLSRLTGPSIPGMISRGSIDEINAFVQEEMPKQFNHEMSFFLEKMGAK